MPEMYPVALQIQPPNPMQGINTLSGILGLQQQRQQLASQTAEATIAGQAARENQGLARLLADPVGNGITDAEGNPTSGAQAKFSAVAPTSGAAKYEQWVNAARAKVALQGDVAGLSEKLRGQVGSVLSADTAGNASREQTIQNLTQLAEDNPSAASVVIRAVAHLPSEPHMTGNDQVDGPAKAQYLQSLNSYRNGFGRSVIGPQAAAELNIPAIGAQYDKQGNLIGTAQSRVSGALGPANQQPGVQVGLGPTQTPGYQAAVAAATTAAGGAGSIDNQTFANIMGSAAKSGQVQALAQKVRELAAQTRTGKYSQEFVDRLTVLKQQDPNATYRQLLEKYAANLKTAVESTGTTDAERAQIGSGFPTPATMNPKALEDAASYAEGVGALAEQRGQNAIAHVRGSGSTQGLTVNDTSFMKGKSPFTFAPTTKRTMPQGPKLSAYAKAHFGGDVGKASAYLKQQGYE